MNTYRKSCEWVKTVRSVRNISTIASVTGTVIIHKVLQKHLKVSFNGAE